MKQIFRDILLVLLVSIIVGMIASCLFLCQATAKDIGMGGAFIVHFIFNFIDSISVSFGIILFIRSCQLLNREYNLYAILIASSIIIIIGKIYYYYNLVQSGINVIAIYIMSTYFLAIAIELYNDTVKSNK